MNWRWILAVCVAVTLSAALSATPSATEPVRQQLDTGRGSVTALATSGSTVVFALDRGSTQKEACAALRVWSISTGRVFAPAEPECESEFRAYDHVAVAGTRLVWSEVYESNHILTAVFSRPSSGAGRARQVIQPLWQNTGQPDAYVGALAADDNVVAFSTQAGEYAGGADASLWVGDTRRVKAIRHLRGWMDHLAVKDGVVAVAYRNGRVELFHTTGRHLYVLPSGTALAGIALDGGHLITLLPRSVVVRDLDSGRIDESLRLATETRATNLEDAAAGYLVYRTSTTLRLLRFANRRDVPLPTPAAPPQYLHARFNSNGLTIAYPHKVRQLNWALLRRLCETP